MGRVAKAEPITHRDDLTAAKAQSEAMAIWREPTHACLRSRPGDTVAK
jgi:hypothetical protein